MSALRAGDAVLFVDGKGRHYLTTLEPGGTFHYHVGVVAHDDVIGKPDGVVVWTETANRQGRLVVLRPRLADYILRMKRGAQVVYPKDIGPILVWGDIGPGHTVVEAGTGSGALTMALLRAVGPEGRVVTVERRPDHADHARKVMTRFLGELPENLEMRHGDVEEALADAAPDRVVLDLPEPWHAVVPAAEAMSDGGVFTSYVPTVPQVQQLRDELRASKRYVDTQTFEFLMREWAADGRSVRPEHQMIGHTGFITVSRLAQDLRAPE